MADEEKALSKWEALKTPKGMIALGVAFATALGGAAYVGEGFTVTLSTCAIVEEAKAEPAIEADEPDEKPEETPAVQPEEPQ